ncbi:MAG TPA: hypothetical protein VMT05_03920 [Terriglobales bacterium]|nr:hypothetical protein [Terriglobales bacterium]
MRHEARYSRPMAFVCAQCDREEKQCDCERFCVLCQGWDNVRLCSDGQYYCLSCREACDLVAQG